MLYIWKRAETRVLPGLADSLCGTLHHFCLSGSPEMSVCAARGLAPAALQRLKVVPCLPVCSAAAERMTKVKQGSVDVRFGGCITVLLTREAFNIFLKGPMNKQWLLKHRVRYCACFNLLCVKRCSSESVFELWAVFPDSCISFYHCPLRIGLLKDMSYIIVFSFCVVCTVILLA